MNTETTQKEKKEKVFKGQFLTPQETAEYLGVSVQNLRVFTRRGQIPYYKPFKTKLVYKITDLDKFLETTKQQVPPHRYTEKTREYLGVEYLPFKEVAKMFALSPSQLRSMCRNREIPHYQPTRNKVFFKRTEVANWIEGTRVAPYYESKADAENYLNRKAL